MMKKCPRLILKEAQAEIERICGIPGEFEAESEKRLEKLIIYGTTHPEISIPPEKEVGCG